MTDAAHHDTAPRSSPVLRGARAGVHVHNYLRLVRAPAVFSALGDPLAGSLLAGGRVLSGRSLGVTTGVAALYLAGMALNDYADREEDARERSDRPIPSGAVSAERAAAVGGALMAAGTAAAWAGGARRSAPALAAAVLAYNFGLKSTPAGPAAMGACRALSLLTGAEAAGGARGIRRGVGAASLLGCYVAGLTLVARGETESGGNHTVLPGVLLSGAALLGAARRGGGRSAAWVGVVAALAGAAAVRAASSPSPATVGGAVGSMIRAIPALDAALAAPRAPVRAAALAAPLLALARWGRRLIPIT